MTIKVEQKKETAVMSEQEAARLFEKLRSGLLATQEALEEIIASKAWEALGYSTFAEAWEDRLSDVKLTGVMEATVVLALFSEGASTTDVALSVAGVGPKKAKAYKQAHSVGMAPKLAERHASKMVNVRPFVRKLPSKRNGLVIDGFTDDEIQAWTDLASDLGVDRSELLREALREGMKGWADVHTAA